MNCNPFLCFLLLYFWGNFSYSQSIIALEDNNTCFVEVLGHSKSLISVNYERLLLKEKKIFYTVRGGIGYTPGINIKSQRLKSTITTPLVFSMLTGKKIIMYN